MGSALQTHRGLQPKPRQVHSTPMATQSPGIGQPTQPSPNNHNDEPVATQQEIGHIAVDTVASKQRIESHLIAKWDLTQAYSNKPPRGTLHNTVDNVQEITDQLFITQAAPDQL